MHPKERGQPEANGGICKKFHHKLQHSNNINERSPAQIHFAEDNSRATLLPIVTGLIKVKDSVKSEANVFLDSEVQISMICNALAETLALESRPISIVITKVGGVKEEFITKLYKVPVYNTDEHKIQVIQAVGIAQISEESPNGNFN